MPHREYVLLAAGMMLVGAVGLSVVTGGRMGDIFGRRTMFLFGVVAFAVSSAFIGLAPTQDQTVLQSSLRLSF